MSDEMARTAVLLVLYRSMTVLSGLTVVLLGYKLFLVGVYEKAGELKTAWGDKSLLLKQAAPGTFFALFGAFVMCVAIWKGVDLWEGVAAKQPDPESVTDLLGRETIARILTSKLVPEKEVLSAIDKAANGHPLSEEERDSVLAWLKTAYTGFRLRAYVPPEGFPKDLPGPGPKEG